MTDKVDIVIAGAGIIGLCSALQLARRTHDRIVVLERGAGLGEGSTGSSSAVCRMKYTRDETVVLARDGIAAYRQWPDFLGLNDPVAQYHETGVIWLGSGDTAGTSIDASRLAALGVAVEVLDDAALRERYPAINPCPIAPDLIFGEPHDCRPGGAHLLEVEGGYVDPMEALHDLLRAVRALGVDVRFNAAVIGIMTAGGRVTGVRTAAGGVECGALVNAAGPWCNDIDTLAGLTNPWPLKATRIQVVQIDRPEAVKGAVPACADSAGGIYFRPQNQGQQIIVGSVLEEDEREAVDPDDFDHSADHGFTAAKLHALQHRLPGLQTLSRIRGYSGLYTMNQSDVHPIVGATAISGYFVANGFSGHGFKLAPAIGSLVAQAVTDIKLTTDTLVGADFLSFDRTPIQLQSRCVLA